MATNRLSTFTILPLSLVLGFGISCNSNFKLKTSPIEGAGETGTENPNNVEMKEGVENISDANGQFREEPTPDAQNYDLRVLDATCTKEIVNLGNSPDPLYTFPPELYTDKVYCIETTAKNAAGEVMTVKFRRVKLERPPMKKELQVKKDQQILDFDDIPSAESYEVAILDTNNNVVATYKSKESLIDLQNKLPVGAYTVMVAGKESAGKNVEVQTYLLKVLGDDPPPQAAAADPSIADFGILFEKKHYQTSTIKRILVQTSLLSGSETLTINGVEYSSLEKIPGYQVGYTAFVVTTDPTLSGLPYGTNNIKLSLNGASEQNETTLPLTIRDYTLMNPQLSSFSLNATGLSGEVGAYGGTVTSGDYILTTGFMGMISQ